MRSAVGSSAGSPSTAARSPGTLAVATAGTTVACSTAPCKGPRGGRCSRRPGARRERFWRSYAWPLDCIPTLNMQNNRNELIFASQVKMVGKGVPTDSHSCGGVSNLCGFKPPAHRLPESEFGTDSRSQSPRRPQWRARRRCDCCWFSDNDIGRDRRNKESVRDNLKSYVG